MKKKISLFTAAAIILSFATGVIAQNVYETVKVQIRPDFIIKIDGEEKIFKTAGGGRVYPILYDGTTYLPVRAIGEIMGKDVYWYEKQKLIELKANEDKNTTVTDTDVIIDNEKNIDNNKNKAEDNTKTKPDKDNVISEEKAMKIVLEKAGLIENEVSFIKVKLERDDGIYKYDVEFKKGYTEYSAELKADDGAIIDWDVDFFDD